MRTQTSEQKGVLHSIEFELGGRILDMIVFKEKEASNKLTKKRVSH